MRQLCYQFIANLGYALAEWAERRMDRSLVEGMTRWYQPARCEHDRRILRLEPRR